MDAMIPMIYVQFLIVMGPALAISGRWFWKIHKEDVLRDEARRRAEERLLHLPKRMPLPRAA